MEKRRRCAGKKDALDEGWVLFQNFKEGVLVDWEHRIDLIQYEVANLLLEGREAHFMDELTNGIHRVGFGSGLKGKMHQVRMIDRLTMQERTAERSRLREELFVMFGEQQKG